MGGDAVFDVDAFADIEGLVVLIIEDVNSRRLGQVCDQLVVEVGGEGRMLEDVLDGFVVFARVEVAALCEELPNSLGVTQGTVAVGAVETKAFDNFVKAVATVFGVKATREFDRTELGGLEIDSQASKFVFKESVVKTGIVSDKNTLSQEVNEFGVDVGKGRSRDEIGLGDAGNGSDDRTDGTVWVDEAGVDSCGRTGVLACQDYTDFDDSV